MQIQYKQTGAFFVATALIFVVFTSAACGAQAPPPANHTINGVVNNTPCSGCLPGESSITVRFNVPPGDYVFKEEPPCDDGESGDEALSSALEAVAIYFGVPHVALGLQVLSDPLVKKIVNKQGGDVAKWLEPVTGERTATCASFCVNIPKGLHYRGYVKWAHDEAGGSACNDVENCNSTGAYMGNTENGHSNRWNMGWSGWTGLRHISSPDGTAACMVFKNWSHNRIRDVAVTYYLAPDSAK